MITAFRKRFQNVLVSKETLLYENDFEAAFRLIYQKMSYQSRLSELKNPDEMDRLRRYLLYKIDTWDIEKQFHELVNIHNVK